MICQIYPVRSADEALKLIENGVDILGLNATELATGSSGPISFKTALEIKNAVKDTAKIVLIALENDPEEILRKAVIIEPDILHISGDTFSATKDFVKKVKSNLPFVKIMQAVQVVDETAVAQAKEYGKYVDYLILDSGSDADKGIGASGETHDWAIDKKIVDSCGVPVIMAGGLSPENVKSAVEQVRPWGVDSMTHTNKDNITDGVKDIKKVKAFCENAKNQ